MKVRIAVVAAAVLLSSAVRPEPAEAVVAKAGMPLGTEAKAWEDAKKTRLEQVRMGIQLELSRAFSRGGALDEAEARARQDAL